MSKIEIINTTADNVLKFGICGYKNLKTEGYPEKIEWIRKQAAKGLRIKTIHSEEEGTLGMIEYMPGEFCWRPVDAEGYMFIQCIFVGFRKEQKGKGYGTLVLEECIKDAREEGMKGVCVVTRKGSFMVGREFFARSGFETADTAPPDFELMVRKFNKNEKPPRFYGDWEKKLKKYGSGLTIIRADQCPYSMKNVKAMLQTAEEKFGLNAKLVELKNHKEAQNSPLPFGTFGVILNGKAVAHHPISNTRLINILNKELKK